ncbi:MAG: hypothetical protein GY953_39355 [bacterium]|nr:hypothetical protein [bacterium]
MGGLFGGGPKPAPPPPLPKRDDSEARLRERRALALRKGYGQVASSPTGVTGDVNIKKLTLGA